VPWYQGLANLAAQLAGSLSGAGLLAALFPCTEDLTTNLGSNLVNPKFGNGRALLGEARGSAFDAVYIRRGEVRRIVW
jgi:hypothetical protein